MTELQQSLMDRIHAFTEARPEGPTTAEVHKNFRSRPEGSVQRALEGLAASGHLGFAHGRWKLKTPAVQLHFQLGGGDSRSAVRP